MSRPRVASESFTTDNEELTTILTPGRPRTGFRRRGTGVGRGTLRVHSDLSPD